MSRLNFDTAQKIARIAEKHSDIGRITKLFAALGYRVERKITLVPCQPSTPTSEDLVTLRTISDAAQLVGLTKDELRAISSSFSPASHLEMMFRSWPYKDGRLLAFTPLIEALGFEPDDFIFTASPSRTWPDFSQFADRMSKAKYDKRVEAALFKLLVQFPSAPRYAAIQHVIDFVDSIGGRGEDYRIFESPKPSWPSHVKKIFEASSDDVVVVVSPSDSLPQFKTTCAELYRAIPVVQPPESLVGAAKKNPVVFSPRRGPSFTVTLAEPYDLVTDADQKSLELLSQACMIRKAPRALPKRG